MKKILTFLVLFLIFNECNASSYLVMDQSSGRVLDSLNGYNKGLIASTTKIMTAMVAIEYGDLDSYVKVGEEILDVTGSSLYLKKGERIKLIDLIYGLMLRSGNDAAVVIALNVAGNVDDFVGFMNNKALDLKMNNTTFINPHGLEDEAGNGNTSTCYDMALLMRYAMDNNIFAKITSAKTYVAKSSITTYKWKNKNKLLFNYEYLTGGKTGYTKKARRTLVTSASKDGKKIIIVTFNYSNDFEFHKKMYKKIFNKYKLVKIINKNNFKLKKVSNGKFLVKNDGFVLLKTNEYENLRILINYYNLRKYSDGDIVGKVNVYLKNNIIYSDYVYFRKKDK